MAMNKTQQSNLKSKKLSSSISSRNSGGLSDTSQSSGSMVSPRYLHTEIEMMLVPKAALQRSIISSRLLFLQEKVCEFLVFGSAPLGIQSFFSRNGDVFDPVLIIAASAFFIGIVFWMFTYRFKTNNSAEITDYIDSAKDSSQQSNAHAGKKMQRT